MSSNRLKFDPCAYNQKLGESRNMMNYTMYPGKFENTSKCQVQRGIIGGSTASMYRGNQTDLESDLRGQTYPGSLCACHKYSPRCSKPFEGSQGMPCGSSKQVQRMNRLPECDMFRYQPIVTEKNLKVHKCDLPQFSKGYLDLEGYNLK